MISINRFGLVLIGVLAAICLLIGIANIFAGERLEGVGVFVAGIGVTAVLAFLIWRRRKYGIAPATRVPWRTQLSVFLEWWEKLFLVIGWVARRVIKGRGGKGLDYFTKLWIWPAKKIRERL